MDTFRLLFSFNYDCIQFGDNDFLLVLYIFHAVFVRCDFLHKKGLRYVIPQLLILLDSYMHISTLEIIVKQNLAVYLCVAIHNGIIIQNTLWRFYQFRNQIKKHILFFLAIKSLLCFFLAKQIKRDGPFTTLSHPACPLYCQIAFRSGDVYFFCCFFTETNFSS